MPKILHSLLPKSLHFWLPFTAITAFEETLNIPYVDPELIHMHTRRLRLIGSALGGKIEWLIRFMEGEEAWLTFSICDDFLTRCQ